MAREEFHCPKQRSRVLQRGDSCADLKGFWRQTTESGLIGDQVRHLGLGDGSVGKDARGQIQRSDQRLIPRSHILGGEKQLPQLVL